MALSRHHAATTRPLSVQEIAIQAEDFEFGTNRSLKNWLRSAQMLLTEAAICEQDGDIQTAYLYLYRHAELILGKLPQHPEFKAPGNQAELAKARKSIQKNFPKLEQWKPRINQRYQRYIQAVEKPIVERHYVEREHFRDEEQRNAQADLRRMSIGSEDGAYDDRTEVLNANEYRQLAIDLAHGEIRRRDATRRAARQTGTSPEAIDNSRRGRLLQPSEHGDDSGLHHRGLDRVSEGIREAGQHLLHHGPKSSHQTNVESHDTVSKPYQYPSVPTREDVVDWKKSPLQSSSKPTSVGMPPARPAKEAPDEQRRRQGPPIPPRPHHSTPSPPAATPSPSPVPPPSSRYTFKPTASTESGAPLRTVLLPPDLRAEFLNVAHPNTLRNLETCGILCGTMISNALFINHLIIPDQKSTSDTCDTTEEGDNALFDFCDSHDLLVCGWIHTHPSQTCFLSSRDLHTSSGYQVMLPEAIAIVCAPRHNPDWGIFRLTDPPGLNAVLNCHQKGIFHPHAETNLYTDALRPGHVLEGPGLKFEVVDLRKQ